jgi:predicted nucleotide-binding protein
VNPGDSDFNQMQLGLINLMNKIADTHEKKVERLIESRKHISYLPAINNKIFLIHGHGMTYVREFKDLMKSRLGIEPIILFEQPDNGKTIIEKIETHGKDCAFAFSIFTPDDWVENNGKKYFQARPNVIYELGWFSGRYGRDKVRIIKQKGTDIPSDLSGLITINFTNSIEEVFLRIEKELKAAGLITS